MWSGNDHENKGLITKKLKKYLEKEYPDRYQQVHAHIMSMSASAIIGVLFTPGLFEEDIKHIIKGERWDQKMALMMRG